MKAYCWGTQLQFYSRLLWALVENGQKVSRESEFVVIMQIMLVVKSPMYHDEFSWLSTLLYVCSNGTWCFGYACQQVTEAGSWRSLWLTWACWKNQGRETECYYVAAYELEWMMESGCTACFKTGFKIWAERSLAISKYPITGWWEAYTISKICYFPLQSKAGILIDSVARMGFVTLQPMMHRNKIISSFIQSPKWRQIQNPPYLLVGQCPIVFHNSLP